MSFCGEVFMNGRRSNKHVCNVLVIDIINTHILLSYCNLTLLYFDLNCKCILIVCTKIRIIIKKQSTRTTRFVSAALIIILD